MNSKKLFTLVSLGLISCGALASCAPANVTPEEGKQVLANMKQAYEKQEVEPARQLSLKQVLKVKSVSTLGKVESEVITNAAVDLDKLQTYFSVKGQDTSLETWAYLDGDQFITAYKANDFARYESVTIAREDIDEAFEELEGVKIIDENTGIEAIEELEEVIKEFEDMNSEFVGEMFGSKVEGEAHAQFKSNKEGQLHFYGDCQFNHARIEDKAFDVSIEGKTKIAFEDYFLSSIESEENIASEVLGNKFASSTYSKLTIKRKAKIKLPNLNDFEKGGFELPELPDLSL